MSDLKKELVVLEKVPLSGFTSWQIGGKADFFCQPESLQQLKEALAWAEARKQTVTLLGGGSNVLVSDEGVRGLVLCSKKLNAVSSQTDQRLFLTCEVGVKKSELLKIFLKHQLAPALFLAGIPGDVGGGVVMNAGVSESLSPREFGEMVDWVEVLRRVDSRGSQAPDDLFELIRLKKDEMHWSYRKSWGWQPGFIYRVGLSWPYQPDPSVVTQVRELNRVRLQKQPLELPSCGSVFKNPPGQKAARLIEQAGLKGAQIGDAQVSLKHANFIVNLGQAKAEDTWDLMMRVREKVFEKFGIKLETEVVRLGEWKDFR